MSLFLIESAFGLSGFREFVKNGLRSVKLKYHLLSSEEGPFSRAFFSAHCCQRSAVDEFEVVVNTFTYIGLIALNGEPKTTQHRRSKTRV